MNTILIKNALLLDGSGKPAEKADILIRGDKISVVDSLINYKASETIDAMGAYVAPGFIDIVNYSDRYLDIFFNPLQENFLRQGITTIIGGHGGFSLAPLLYGSLQSVRRWADVSKINVDWHSLSEFFKTMKKKSLGVNFGTLAGHATVRRALIGEPVFRDLTQSELKVFYSVFKRGLKDGAFGISLGLNNPQGVQASYFEIKNLADIVQKTNRIFSVNLKNDKDELIESFKKIIFLAKETGAKFLITNLKPLIGFEGAFWGILDLIDANSANAGIILSPSFIDGRTMLLSDFLPQWLKKLSKEEILEQIKNLETRKKILKDVKELDWNMIITNAPGNEYLAGKSLKEFSLNRDLDAKEGFLELLKITDLRTEVLLKDVNFKELVKSLSWKEVMISSGSMPAALLQQSFLKFLELCDKEGVMPIEEAVRKITFMPAKVIGLEKRGEIKNGYFADLVIFKDAEIKEVIVNGKRAIKDGQLQNIFNGTILKHVSI